MEHSNGLAIGSAMYGRLPREVAEPTNPDRRCRRCGATTGLRLLPGNPLVLAPREWECADGCAGVAS